MRKITNVFNEWKDGYFSKILFFSWVSIKKNWLIWSFFFFLIISQPLTILILNLMNYKLIDKSLFISLIPQIFLIILNFLLINILFSESRNNSIDYLFLSLPISKTKIYLSRFVFIICFGLIALVIEFLLSSIIILTFNNNSIWILYLIISNVFINSFINIFYISLIIIFATLFKRIWFAIVSFIFILLCSSPIILRNADDNYQIQYNQKNSDSFAKLSLISNNNFKTLIVDQINNVNINDNSNTIGEINSSPIYNYFVPGEMITSFNSLLLKNLISFNDNQLIRRKYSILKNNYKSFNFSNYDNEFENAIVLRPYDKNPLSLNNEEYENLLLSNISKIIEEGNANIIDLNDSMLVQNLLNSLQDYKKINWIYLSQKEIRTLEKILGIDTNFNQLFYYLSNYSWLNKKTPNLLIKIQNKYSKELSNLFNFLWTSEITQNNINNTFENLNPVFPNVDDLYPSIMTYSDSSKPLKSDIDFIKNDLIRFNNSTISYLRIDGTYQTIDNLSNIDISIVDEKSWRKFVEENTMSLSDAKILIDNLSEELSNMSIVNFSKNKIDIYKYSYFFTINDQSYLSYSEIYVTTLVFVFIGTFWISIWLFKKSNYKNIEQN